MLAIKKNTINDFIDYANATPSLEVTGLLVGYKNEQVIDYLIPIRNVSDSPETQFTLDPRAFIAAIYKMEHDNAKFIGVIHSHPSSPAFPSSNDIANWHYPEISYWIYSITHQSLKAYGISGEKITPLEYTIIE